MQTAVGIHTTMNTNDTNPQPDAEGPAPVEQDQKLKTPRTIDVDGEAVEIDGTDLDHAKPFPLDFDAIKKGDRIPPETVCNYFEIEQSSRMYSLAALNFAKEIQRELAARGRYVMVCIRKDFVCVMTDAEAAEHVEREFEVKLASARKLHAHAQTIDRSNLDTATSARLDRVLMVQAAKLAAVRKAEANIQKAIDKFTGGQSKLQVEPKKEQES